MTCLLFLFCSHEQDKTTSERLHQWDALAEDRPQAVSDSLKQLNPSHLSRANRAYYGLLKTITDDKTYADFTSDSLINSVRSYYNRYQKGSDNHIRSLVYQGIVRYRMGATDSTVLMPLKEAEFLFKSQKQQNFSVGYLMNYYLAVVHSKNGNLVEAKTYSNSSLHYAKIEKNDSHIYDAYLSLFWNVMRQEKFNQGKLYLDTLHILPNKSPNDMYFLFNAEAAYFDTQNEFSKALDKEKEQQRLLPYIKENIDAFRIYYSISDRYNGLNRLDSAMYYAKLAIEHISDSTYKLNYLLYENAADISEKQQNYLTANQYRKMAASVRDKNIEREKDKSIFELEKRYNLSESENKVLKAQRQSRFFTTAAIIAVLFMLLLYIYFTRQKMLAAARNKQLEAEKNAAQAQARETQAQTLLIQQQAETQEQILEIYGSFLQQYAIQQQSAKEMAAKVRGKNTALADYYDENLKELNKQFSTLTGRLFTPVKLQKQLRLSFTPDFLNQSDCLILFMLASGTDNAQIASLLNTTPETFKVRKAKLKKKIATQANSLSDGASLLNLFF